MLLTFNIEYHTEWGEELRICGSASELGGMDENKSVALQTHDGIHWCVSVKIPFSEKIKYYYSVFKSGTFFRKECLPIHTLRVVGTRVKKQTIYDSWREAPAQSYFYSSAFTQTLFKREYNTASPDDSPSLCMKAYCLGLGENYSLAISGNQRVMGHWDVKTVLLPTECNSVEYQFVINRLELVYPLEYKFVLYNLKDRKIEEWEKGPNLYLADPNLSADETLVIPDRFVHFELPLWKGAGVAIPVFSLRSDESFGVGDFVDLKKMIKWAASTGQSLVQILPINDTTMTHTWTDSYPYNGISIYALHPMYLRLSDLGEISDKEKRIYFDHQQKRLNTLTAVDYEQVNQFKWEYFRLIFAQEANRVFSSQRFRDFFEENKKWLVSYAAYSYLRDVYKTSDFRKWSRYSVYNANDINSLCATGTKEYDKIAIYYYLQYYLHEQLLEASLYARENGIVLKGDIPIGISRNSVEAWVEPHYFNFDGQAGAPPDDFSVNGQNWGFPTYNWDVMKDDKYRWWIKRFRKMSDYFEAYRIDHILGFFRIWEIPTHSVHGLLGQFVPALPMNKNEIESYGLQFDDCFLLEPYIHDSFLSQLFGANTDLVKETFLLFNNLTGLYQMRKEFDTQRKVEAYFENRTDVESLLLRNGLYTLISNVLFVRDRRDSQKYHPRIGVQHEFVYRTLSESQKTAFDRLYEHYYYQRHDRFWYEEAMKKLPIMIHSNQMMVCGEDLGMIPGCVEGVMNELQILSLEIERMPKATGVEFSRPEEYPYRSVCSISTHDMSTLREWWKEDLSKTQHYYNQILGYEGFPPKEIDERLCEEIVNRHLKGNSMFAILSFQDWLSIDQEQRNPDVNAERINVPANPCHYWRYRMHLTLEELLKANRLNDKIRTLIDCSGRSPQK